ncbi:LacI family DNA-binding transcriptional regulator [Actinoplanes sp. NPDC049265]|uniref:LacI family DNA-binding transcriptional regulator n=1 Tax=Actinoplanes sp. NPDC049265 TaxID=3363902 RepID=UPI00371826C2
MSGVTGRRQAVRISDVARAAGVSKTLVSYALNDRPGVRESTRAHIVETARSMGWTPSFRARALSASRAYAIGLIFPAAPADWWLRLMAGLHSTLVTAQYSLVTEVVQDPEAEESAYHRLALDGRVDGLVVVDPRPDDTRFRLLAKTGLPYVSLGRPPEPTTMPVLVHDESAAVAAVVAHLAGLGHRRVALVGLPRSRRELFETCFREHDVVGSDTDRATAIVHADDLAAAACLRDLAGRGQRVPTDVSVVGWGDLTVAGLLHPALSTAGRDPYDDGRLAARLLLEAIDGKEFPAPVTTAGPVFVDRASIGPALA